MKRARWACTLSPSFPRTHTNYTHTDPFAHIDNAHAYVRAIIVRKHAHVRLQLSAKQAHLRARTQAVLLANINTHARVINNRYFYSAKARACARTRIYIYIRASHAHVLARITRASALPRAIVYRVPTLTRAHHLARSRSGTRYSARVA